MLGKVPCEQPRDGGTFPIAFTINLLLSAAVFAQTSHIAYLPPMGWNTFGVTAEWDAAYMKRACDALVSTGLRDVGYIYCNADGNNGGESPYWPAKSGFVNFTKPAADYAHSKGLKYGVYTSEFTNPQQITNDLVAAGCDFIKVDAWTTPSSNAGWKTLGDALLATGRDIVYSTHSSAIDVSNMIRTSGDADGSWGNVVQQINDAYYYLPQVKHGHWADPDMMVTQWLANTNERRSHMGMWCMMAAPLIINWEIVFTGTPSADIADAIAVQSNTEVIAVDQDSLGTPGKRIKTTVSLEVWVKDLNDGSKAVAFFNRGASAATGAISKSELGWGTAATIYARDLWSHTTLPTFTDSYSKSVASHGTDIIKMSTKPIGTPVETLRRMERSAQWLGQYGHQVLPPSRVLKIMQKTDSRARVFDARGRSLAAINSAIPASGAFVVRPSEEDRSTTLLVWPAGPTSR